MAFSRRPGPKNGASREWDHREDWSRSGSRDRFVVLDGRERVIEVVEQGAPLLVLGRPAEAFSVVLETVPLNEQQIALRVLDAA